MKSALRKMYYGHSAERIVDDILEQLPFSEPALPFEENMLFLLKEN